jgi:large subunit ribosomal protein L31
LEAYLEIKKKFVFLHPKISREISITISKANLNFLKNCIMKNGIHPENYRLVVFKDMSNDEVFLCKSTAETKDSIEYEGQEYPLIKMEISSTSHPFYTGKTKLVDTAGRVDKFMNKYKKFAK